MPVLKFRIYWEEDDLVYRDIDVLSGQSFADLHEAIVKAFEFDGKHPATFIESNDKGEKFRVLSSEVLTNKKDAPALSMVKTPVSALISVPDQKFIYEYDPVKQWTFLAELIGISNEQEADAVYPKLTRKEGMAPAQYKPGGAAGLLPEIEEKYDLGADEMAEGFGDEGEDSDEESTEEESYGEEGYDE